MELRDAYRETVMGRPEYGIVCGNSLRKSLEAELKSAIATGIGSKDQSSHYLKRDILVATNDVIGGRQRFSGSLEIEFESLQNTLEEHHVINGILDDLPCIVFTNVVLRVPDSLGNV